MIGKVIIGKSFYGCLSYCLEDKKKVPQKKQKGEENSPTVNRAEVLCYNYCFGDTKELSKQFNDVARLRHRLRRSVLHLTLSFAPEEKLANKTLQQAVEACAAAMGIDKNQYVAVVHRDTKHQHLHIVANRVGFDGAVVSDSNNYKRMAQCCRKVEEALGLQKVLSPRRFLSPEEQGIPRKDDRKQGLQTHISLALAGAKTTTEFMAMMTTLGYRVEWGRGIAFIDSKGVRTKGSDVGYPLQRLEKIVAEKRGERLQETVLEKRQEGLSQTAITPPDTGTTTDKKEEQKMTVMPLSARLKPVAENKQAAPKALEKKEEKKRKPGW